GLVCGPSGQPASTAAGSQPKRHPVTPDTSGSSAARPRTAVDLAVPFSPRTSTPPIAGDTAFRIRASRMDSEPTTAVNGKSRLVSTLLFVSAPLSTVKVTFGPPDRLRWSGTRRATGPVLLARAWPTCLVLRLPGGAR